MKLPKAKILKVKNMLLD